MPGTASMNLRAKERSSRAREIGFDDDIEPLSHKKLIEAIELNHPFDSEDKVRFGWRERLTVKDFEWKIIDALYLYSLS